MKTPAKDVVYKITPNGLAQCLSARGWIEAETNEPYARVFAKQVNGARAEILAPKEADLADYGDAVLSAICVAAEADEAEPEAVMKEALIASGAMSDEDARKHHFTISVGEWKFNFGLSRSQPESAKRQENARDDAASGSRFN